jgi:hypothetical protein
MVRMKMASSQTSTVWLTDSSVQLQSVRRTEGGPGAGRLD